MLANHTPRAVGLEVGLHGVGGRGAMVGQGGAGATFPFHLTAIPAAGSAPRSNRLPGGPIFSPSATRQNNKVVCQIGTSSLAAPRRPASALAAPPRPGHCSPAQDRPFRDPTVVLRDPTDSTRDCHRASDPSSRCRSPGFRQNRVRQGVLPSTYVVSSESRTPVAECRCRPTAAINNTSNNYNHGAVRRHERPSKKEEMTKIDEKDGNQLAEGQDNPPTPPT